MAEKEYIERGSIRCKNCIHNLVCLFRNEINDIDEWLDEFGCGDYKSTADVVEVVHGEWGKEKWTHTNQHICSVCHKTSRVHPESVMYRYCPYCGAKMDGKDGDGK